MKILKGVLSGIIGGITFIFVSFLLRILFSGIMNQYTDDFISVARPEVMNPSINIYILIYSIYIIFGIIIGLFYTMLKGSIPGKNFLTKGIVYGLIVWVFIIVMHNVLVYIEFKVPLVPLLIGTFIMDLIGILLAAISIALIQDKAKNN